MKPNKKVINAIQSYYCNRSLQAIQKWDKDGDLDKIFAETRAQGFGRSEACSGTFWFSYKTPKGKIKTLKTSESLFPKFEYYEP